MYVRLKSVPMTLMKSYLHHQSVRPCVHGDSSFFYVSGIITQFTVRLPATSSLIGPISIADEFISSTRIL